MFVCVSLREPLLSQASVAAAAKARAAAEKAQEYAELARGHAEAAARELLAAKKAEIAAAALLADPKSKVRGLEAGKCKHATPEAGGGLAQNIRRHWHDEVRSAP